VHHFEEMHPDGRVIHFSYEATLHPHTFVLDNATNVVGIRVCPPDPHVDGFFIFN
jgi:hypothetical protein